MTTYSEKPLRILGLTVLLSISEHIALFCPQKVYIKVYTGYTRKSSHHHRWEGLWRRFQCLWPKEALSILIFSRVFHCMSGGDFGACVYHV